MSSKDTEINHLPLVQSTSGHKLYKRRWIILTLYILYAAINAFQWFEYAIIANVIMKFYGVSSVSVDWTSIIYMALYMPMVIPASYLMEKLDLRKISIIGVLGTATGTIIKIFSLSPGRMWMTYLSQTILSSMQVFILALPLRIAATWLKLKSMCFGGFGTQLVQAVGFIIPPMVVKNTDNLEQISDDLGVLIESLAAFTSVVTIIILVYFPARPPLPPNQVICEGRESSFLKSLKRPLSDRSFGFHAVAYGISIAVFVSISTLLNQFMLFYFAGSEEDAGRIGLIMVVLGMAGAIVFGHVLDKTHSYKRTTLSMYISSLLSVIAFMYSLKYRSKIFVYISGALVGLFINAYMPVGLELSIELTYPEPESTSSGILISMTQTLGVIFTLLLGWLFSTVGCFWALASMVFFLLVGTFLTAMISNVTKRQDVFKQELIKLNVCKYVVVFY
ncbi:hypothetical protein Zmor_001116 [Zophobas morio]|uniref:Major facilitator superfamily (MFS) profile domain-containing protein n=1 Tax=Zophobas morio TaxID=2755281 RepID=A0AA38IXU3_9CUCU|nr:hypothetical protein Zmor_001116 [Zophobas morio]